MSASNHDSTQKATLTWGERPSSWYAFTGGVELLAHAAITAA